ncbi:glucoamylase family protein [Agrobacterium rosae]|uniref:Glucoamylase family protein n=1 Tax=Agrobacterium rosae TaxID=1972867 RepID=A0AAW9FIQ6_9HYPH|nr:glucoamylase family protein [Agrobacterium rosae]MDX8302703.1 glucoamylase family protein [Agrobacterium rosae]
MDSESNHRDAQSLSIHRSFPEDIENIQYRTFEYFWLGSHPVSGLARDRLSSDGKPINEIASVSGTGFSFLAIIVGAERHWITRDQALDRVTTMVGALRKAKRFHGAFAHFLHGDTSEVIPFGPKDDGGDLVETAFLLQGLICARQYFSRQTLAETRFRALAQDLITGVEWDWYTKGEDGPLWWHWSPKHRWCFDIAISGWNEALVCYVLATGAQHHSIDPVHYHQGWARAGAMVNGNIYLGTALPLGEPFGGPLFLSQYSFCGLDPRRLSDRYGDYWQQVKAHTRINYDYCQSRYPETDLWGMTASDGPKGYSVHSPTQDNDVISPTAALSSFPVCPQKATDAARAFLRYGDGKLIGRYGFVDAFSPGTGWTAKTHLAIDQGPIVAMMENYRSGLLWSLFMGAPEVQRGLDRLGFTTASIQDRV